MQTTHRPSDHSDNGITVLSWLLYILAVMTLVLGFIVGLGIVNVPQVINSYAPLLGAAGGGPLMNLLLGSLKGVFINIGIAVIVASLAGAVVMFASGLLLRRSRGLARRVEQLETQLTDIRVAYSTHN